MFRSKVSPPKASNPFSKQFLGEFDSAPGKLLSERFLSMAIVLPKIPVIGLPLSVTFKLCGLVCKKMENLSGTAQKHDLKMHMHEGYMAADDDIKPQQGA